jgi:hypothetical protein
MHAVIPWRESLDAAKARIFDAPSEHEMPVDSVPARRELRERHPHLKRDPRFLSGKIRVGPMAFTAPTKASNSRRISGRLPVK